MIGHLVVANIYADYSASTGAFYGAPQNYIDKAAEVANAIRDLPAPPETFRAFSIPGRGSQTLVGFLTVILNFASLLPMGVFPMETVITP